MGKIRVISFILIFVVLIVVLISFNMPEVKYSILEIIKGSSDDSIVQIQTSNDNTPFKGAGDPSSSSGGSGGSSGSSQNEEAIKGCYTSKISYSLRSFYEKVECQEEDSGNCIKAKIVCSVEAYHLDEASIGGNFKIDYLLTDSKDDILDSILISKYIEYQNFEVFEAEFIYSNPNGVGQLKCIPKVEEVPTKQVCSN